jgi:hypothetical protein
VSRNLDRRPPLYGLGERPSCSRQDRKLRASEVRLAAEMRALAATTRRKRRHLLYGMFGTVAVVVVLSMAIFTGGRTDGREPPGPTRSGATGSGLAGQALQRPSPGRVKARHLLREMTERNLPVLFDKPFDL